MLLTGNYSEEATTKETFWMTTCNPYKHQNYRAFRCKDFFQDIFSTMHTKKKISIYNIITRPEKVNSFVAISHPTMTLNPENYKRFSKLFPIKIFTYHSYNKKENIIYFKINKRKKLPTPPEVSLFSMLFRVAAFFDDSYENLMDFFNSNETIFEQNQWFESIDNNYINKSRFALSLIIKEKKKFLLKNSPGWDAFKSSTMTHNKSGLITYITNYKKVITGDYKNLNLRQVKGWHILEENKVVMTGIKNKKQIVDYFKNNKKSKKDTQLVYLEPDEADSLTRRAKSPINGFSSFLNGIAIKSSNSFKDPLRLYIQMELMQLSAGASNYKNLDTLLVEKYPRKETQKLMNDYNDNKLPNETWESFEKYAKDSNMDFHNFNLQHYTKLN